MIDRKTWQQRLPFIALALGFFACFASSCDSGTAASTSNTAAPDVGFVLDVAGLPDSELDQSVADSEQTPDLIPLDTLVDTQPPPDTTKPPEDANTCTEGGCACTENAQCASGYCLDDAGSGTCAVSCSAGCPSGTSCKTVKAGADDVAVCMPKFPRICDPCNSDADCQGGAAGSTAVCIDYGNGKSSPGKFCGGLCDDQNPCPVGYSCLNVTSGSGASIKQCKRDDLTCSCSSRAEKLGLGTTCSTGNDYGSCSGKRFCDTKGLSTCNAANAAPETCDGQDNNCNGQTDEAACDDKNACTSDACDPIAKKCTNANSAQPCDDGSVCTSKDLCVEGQCTGTNKNCDDGNPCTDETCDPKAGCKYAFATGPCQGDNPCEIGATCQDGQCQGGKIKVCNDSNPCTADSCVDGKCVFKQTAAPCDDSNACTNNDLCDTGVCSGTTKKCDDGNPCTDDACELASGCKSTPTTATCDDGNACTVKDACAGGTCVGTPNKCDDGKPCTLDSCSATKGCVNAPVSGACDDGNPCTSGDLCDASGGCQSGTATKCDDGNACTDDACNPSQGCVYTPNTAACDDGEKCTVGDSCKAGKCSAGVNQCGCQQDSDCSGQATSLCAGKSYCDKGSLPYKCATDPKTAIVCNTSGDNACKQTACDPGTGQCATKGINESGLCSDGDACTTGDACTSGVCKPSAIADCEDNNACTDDVCSKIAGCSHTNNTAACNDGDPCTKNDSCANGACKGVGGAGCCVQNTDCDDKNPCTVDTCLGTGACKNDATAANGQSCDSDGDGCTVGDVCTSGQCVVGKAADCSAAADVCNSAACKSTGAGSYQCLKTAKVDGSTCDDGLYCSIGEACKAGKCTGGTGMDCTTSGCTTGSCDEATKACKGTPKADGVACDADGSGCTKSDACLAGQCVKGSAVDCSNPTDVCNDWGCKSTGATTYQCQPTAKTKGAPCEDGKFCTDGDSCDGAGKCLAGGAKACSEVADSCNDATCDETNKKCVPKAKVDGTTCNDGDVCTPTDACKTGLCVGQNNQCGDLKISTFKTAGASLVTAKAAAILDLGGGHYRVAWGNSDTTVSTRSSRDEGSRENTEQTYSYQNVVRNVGLTTAPTGGSDVIAMAEYNDSGSCVPGTYYCSCTTSNGCPINACSTATYSRYTSKSYFQYQRSDNWLANSGALVNIVAPTTASCGASSVTLILDKFVVAPYADGRRLMVWGESGTVYKAIINADNSMAKNLGTDATMKQFAAAVASDNSSIIVWSDGAEIWAQMYYADGSTNGTKFQVNTNAVGAQTAPFVAYQPSGRYIVAWQTDTTSGDVAMQVFKPDPGVPINSEVVVNTTTTGYQGAPTLAVFQDGSFMVAFEDGSGKDSAGYGILGQWYSSTGAKVGGEKILNAGVVGDQRYPVGKGLSSDVGVIAWTSLADSHIYARRFDKLGNVYNGAKELLVNSTKTGEQGNPAIAVAGSGAFVVAFDSEGIDGDATGIGLQRYAADGSLVGLETVVNTYKTGSQTTPAVGMDTAGNYVVVWDSVGQDGDIDGVYGQRFKSDGSKSGSEFQVSQTTANDQWRPSVAMQSDSSFAAVWESYGQTGGSNYDVVLRCYDASGVAYGNEQIVNSVTADKQQFPTIVAFADGRYLVTWQSFGQDGAGWGVYGQMLYKDCKAIGGPFAINTTTTGDQTSPKAAVDGSGNFTAVWASLGQDGDNFGIYAQRFDKSNGKVGLEFKINPITAGEQSKPAIAFLSTGNTLTVWQTAGEDESGYGLKAAQYKDATQQGLDLMPNTTFTGNQSLPAVVGRSDGSYVLVWRSDAQDGSKGAVIARILK